MVGRLGGGPEFPRDTFGLFNGGKSSVEDPGREPDVAVSVWRLFGRLNGSSRRGGSSCAKDSEDIAAGESLDPAADTKGSSIESEVNGGRFRTSQLLDELLSYNLVLSIGEGAIDADSPGWPKSAALWC